LYACMCNSAANPQPTNPTRTLAIAMLLAGKAESVHESRADVTTVRAARLDGA
jgi:hypothetical protein